jgi:hypothetical protein
MNHQFFEGTVMEIEKSGVPESIVKEIKKSGITDKESFLKFWLPIYDSERIEKIMKSQHGINIVQYLRSVHGLDEYEAWHISFRMIHGRID